MKRWVAGGLICLILGPMVFESGLKSMSDFSRMDALSYNIQSIKSHIEGNSLEAENLRQLAKESTENSAKYLQLLEDYGPITNLREYLNSL